MRDGKTKNYSENAREILKKAGVDRRRETYVDIKYVSVASGTAYLFALEAIRALLILHLNLDEDFIKKIWKDRDYVQGLLKDAYDILHPIDAGFEAVEKSVKFVESYLYA